MIKKIARPICKFQFSSEFLFFSRDPPFIWPGLKDGPQEIILNGIVKGERLALRVTKSLPHVRFFTLRRFYWLFYDREHCKSLHPAPTALPAPWREVAPLGAHNVNYASRERYCYHVRLSISQKSNIVPTTLRNKFLPTIRAWYHESEYT